ncbi:MAG: response regulator [Candidatus Omnitrophica bacterium]|nr:response regulator [Candidatus Omnitrophota bacterium]
MGQEQRRVLIVDDEQAVGQVLERFFVSRGLAVALAFSGEQALARLQEEAFDVVLIDILLPGIHGIEVLKQAKRRFPNAKVAMLTGLEDEALRAKARLHGADAYVTKPFDFSDPVWSMLAGPVALPS